MPVEEAGMTVKSMSNLVSALRYTKCGKAPYYLQGSGCHAPEQELHTTAQILLTLRPSTLRWWVELNSQSLTVPRETKQNGTSVKTTTTRMPVMLGAWMSDNGDNLAITPKQPTDYPNDSPAPQTTRLRPKQPTYDPSTPIRSPNGPRRPRPPSNETPRIRYVRPAP
ncbi:hypothetical protein PAXINDRAFT_19233 [Paxillus involutus ATCC 200175]|uniref:Uncharacterized protein n=1 Tax=Paxillus involutus ATCC 200175 TaxID=664439 RepID=A0A0C9SNA5_PAXIN|nr:hypothetical protein PAXINDRAFT_19233 [Paxillus involutus ATCC 200175]